MYEELYQENKGLLRVVAWRYAAACERDRAVSVEDLTQAGFFGLVKASKTFDKDKGSWATWAAWAITDEIYKALGLRDGKRTKAHTGAQSLDAPLRADDPDGETGIDALGDGNLPAIDEELNRENMQKYVRRAVERLQEAQQRKVIKICGLDRRPYEEAAAALGVSVERVRQIRARALARLRKDKELRDDARADIAEIELQTPYYCRVTVPAFNTTHTSATEKAVLWRLDQMQRRAATLEKLNRIEQELSEREAVYREKAGITGKGDTAC